MKQSKNAITSLMAVVLLTIIAAMTVSAAAPPLEGRLVLRPLTPGDISIYKLPSTTETSPGLTTVGKGAPVYLEAEINSAIPAADIVGVTWALTNRPAFSAAFLTNSPLGTNVPVYGPGDRSLYQVAGAAGRMLLRPDLVGQYTVVATIVTTSSGSATVTNTITAGTYMGVNTCALCHSGSREAPDKFTPWEKTGHAKIFTEGINGVLGTYRSSCISCHTVGYDPNTNAIVNPDNGGFDDVAKQLGWTFPTVLAPTNWAYMQAVYPSLANLANIQCENCHGPGSQHAYSLGDPTKISKTFASGDCNQCHDAPTHHIKGAEWYNSRHAVAVEETGSSCGRCHTAQGFANYVAGAPAVETPYEVITCTACHEPHSAANTNQLRTLAPVTLMDAKTTITTNTAGKGLLCMNCHMSRRDATNYVEVTTGSSRFGPHHGPQADMLVGANAVNYNKVIPSSAHKSVVGDACVTCHMQTVTDTNILTHAGGHTFAVSWDTGTNTVQLKDACVDCHGPISSFNFARQDYDGNGVVEGVQTEVRGLLSELALLLPPVGVAKTNHSPSNISINSSWTKPQLRAGYNYLFVVEDGSYGIHNLSYAIGLLKASIGDLTGDGNNDSLPDAWQTQYFGSPTNPNAAPNAAPAGDGVPNWLKYSLGLDPWVPGNWTSIPGSVVWANGKQIGGGTNTIQIYTAAEVSFNTEVGRTYQIQSVSSLSSGWQNVGTPIPGTGNAISYVTPTRQNVQQFYRVYSY
jgi:hypothetical protein